jgi:hypothetical protein
MLQNVCFSLRLRYHCLTSLSFYTLVMKDLDSVPLQPDDFLELSSNAAISEQFCTRFCYVTEERWSDKDKCKTNWPGGCCHYQTAITLGSYVAGFSNFAGGMVLCSVSTILIIIISFHMHPMINWTKATDFENCPLPYYYIDYYDN